jgi:hypothetical protein
MPQWRQDYPNNRPPPVTAVASAPGHFLPPRLVIGMAGLASIASEDGALMPLYVSVPAS